MDKMPGHKEVEKPAVSLSKATPLGGLNLHRAQEPHSQPQPQIEDHVETSSIQTKPFLRRGKTRRRYCEIERIYQCEWNGCDKAYGTLSHLNAHVTARKHGDKRVPSGEPRSPGGGVLNNLQSSSKFAWIGVARKRRSPLSACSTEKSPNRTNNCSPVRQSFMGQPLCAPLLRFQTQPIPVPSQLSLWTPSMLLPLHGLHFNFLIKVYRLDLALLTALTTTRLVPTRPRLAGPLELA